MDAQIALCGQRICCVKTFGTFSPAAGAHTSKLLPMKYFWMKRQSAEMESNDYQVVMASIDVRDAFLQVEQNEPTLVHLQNEPFVINRNLPGQRLGAKQRFLHLQAFLKERTDFQFSAEPCMARNSKPTMSFM
jgi:hypothetical protein